MKNKVAITKKSKQKFWENYSTITLRFQWYAKTNMAVYRKPKK
jgi:hypothetical protein